MSMTAPAAVEVPEVAADQQGELRGNLLSGASSSQHTHIQHVQSGLDDRREERRRQGFIKFREEYGVPDVGGIGWRSKTGHLLKNQTYYSSVPGQNDWNNPTLAGPYTWKHYHGPKLRTDAPMMERLDRLDKEQLDWEAKKMFVNTVRVQTLDRFYNQKVTNQEYECADAWAPHRRARKEVHNAHDRFQAELDSMPLKELKKVLTDTVLHHDRDAIRAISGRIQKEETYKMAWKEMEKERRLDIREDFEHRMAYNEMLTIIAGQPPRMRDPNHAVPNDCTARIEELAKPKEPPPPDDITSLSDYRGLIHVDHQAALEGLFPGKGTELSRDFRDNATGSAKGGWPPPPAADTPEPARRPTKTRNPTLMKGSVPVSRAKLDSVMSRTNDDALAQTAQLQFERTTAPQCPDQSRQMVKEHISHGSAMNTMSINSGGSGGGDVSMHSTKSVRSSVGSQKEGHQPPPLRAYFYPSLVKTSASAEESSGTRKPPPRIPSSSRKAPKNSATSSDNATAPSSARQKRPDSEESHHSHVAAEARSLAIRDPDAKPTLNSVCEELDNFDKVKRPVALLGNFFRSPRNTRSSSSGGDRSAKEPAASGSPLPAGSAN
eukprot:gnl/TRDRNA2_/TRDRNA2_84901_c0_seq1.p1 gnl/TRDRNA2_/TRDRNA2_84901_c0~~gnl/TRDRNA2_/TRDRNA2_84901_c0_seq1.p1  ORF type:complete len:605 (-),score=96.09 gnl/TRDRNA2_/TRDRNA2_84901_c0_seq1:77-1891(-)